MTRIIDVPLMIGQSTIGFTKDFAHKVYKNCPIFHHEDFEVFYQRIKSIIEGVDRVEHVEMDESGNVIASMVFHKEEDMHVGDCLSVLLAYSEGTMTKGYRSLIKVAKHLGIPYVCYTKETKRDASDFEYKMVYRKVLK